MSRSIGSTRCHICYSAVVLDDGRPQSVRDGAHFFAAAHCRRCDAKYLAWLEFRIEATTPGDTASPDWHLSSIVDLSFRHSFSSEPSADDLPHPAVLRAIHRDQCFATARNLRKEAASFVARAEECEREGEIGESEWEQYRELPPDTVNERGV